MLEKGKYLEESCLTMGKTHSTTPFLSTPTSVDLLKKQTYEIHSLFTVIFKVGCDFNSKINPGLFLQLIRGRDKPESWVLSGSQVAIKKPW